MTETNNNSNHLTPDEMVACALGSGSESSLEHLNQCNACRDETEEYRTILRGIRTVFATPAPKVHVFHCQHGLMTEEHACTIEHPVTGHQLSITCHNGWLKGQLVAGDGQPPVDEATSVRLFSRQGLVGNVRVDDDGSFLVRCLSAGERHSMTVVLPGDSSALQLLSNS